MSEFTNPETSSIRRAPSMDVRLAHAIRRLHELGPRLVLELEAEIEELQSQIGRLRETAGQSPGKSSELIGLLKS